MQITSQIVFWKFFLLIYLYVFSQGERIIRINEVLPINKTNIIDPYGSRIPWFEIHNFSYNQVDISYMYITNDTNNKKKFRISDLGENTKIQPKGFIIFYADGNSAKGPFHVPFHLDTIGYIALYDADGKTLIDFLSYKVCDADHSFGRFPDGSDSLVIFNNPTPGNSNVQYTRKTSAEIFGIIDPSGFLLTFISMSVVFIILLMIYFIYKLFNHLSNRKKIDNNRNKSINNIISNETIATIAATLYFYQSTKLKAENAKITIKKIPRPYSPWSSKIYSLRKHPKNW